MHYIVYFCLFFCGFVSFAHADKDNYKEGFPSEEKNLLFQFAEKYLTFIEDKELQETDTLLNEMFSSKGLKKQIYFLGAFNNTINNKQEIYYPFFEREVRKVDISDEPLNQILIILSAKLKLEFKKIQDALYLLNPIAFLNKSPFFSQISKTYLKALLANDNFEQALDYFYSQNLHIGNTLTKFEINELVLEFATLALNKSDTFALEFLKRSIPFLKIEKEPFEKVQLLQSIFDKLNNSKLIQEIPLKNQLDFYEFKNKLAKEVFIQTSIISLKQEPFNPERLKKLNQELQFQDKVEIAERLMNLRNFSLAEIFLKPLYVDRLKNPSLLDEGKIYFIYGRCLNSLELPLEAANVYQTMMNEVKNSFLRDRATVRYLRSLYFAKKHTKIIAFMEKLTSSIRAEGFDYDWFYFWNLYLNQNVKKIKDFYLKKVKNNKKINNYYKFIYWAKKTQERMHTIIDENVDVEWEQIPASSPYFIIKNNQGLDKIFEKDLKNESISFPFDEIAQLKEIYPNSSDANFNQDYLFLKYMSEGSLKEFSHPYLHQSEERKKLEASGLTFHELSYLSYLNHSYNMARSYAQSSLKEKEEVQANQTTPLRINFEKINYPLAYWNLIKSVSQKLSLNPFWLLSIMRNESHYKVHAESPAGALGLMQIMPHTGTMISSFLSPHDKFYSLQLKQASTAIAFSGWYLRYLLSMYNNNIVLATVAYNAGPKAVNRWLKRYPTAHLDEFIEHIPYAESYNYFFRVFPSFTTYNELYASEKNHSLPSFEEKYYQPIIDKDFGEF